VTVALFAIALFNANPLRAYSFPNWGHGASGYEEALGEAQDAESPLILYYLYHAYSGRFRPAIPEEAGHPFRLIPATDSGGSRPPIPEHSGHPFN
jgi:hypothetical protein